MRQLRRIASVGSHGWSQLRRASSTTYRARPIFTPSLALAAGASIAYCSYRVMSSHVGDDSIDASSHADVERSYSRPLPPSGAPTVASLSLFDTVAIILRRVSHMRGTDGYVETMLRLLAAAVPLDAAAAVRARMHWYMLHRVQSSLTTAMGLNDADAWAEARKAMEAMTPLLQHGDDAICQSVLRDVPLGLWLQLYQLETHENAQESDDIPACQRSAEVVIAALQAQMHDEYYIPAGMDGDLHALQQLLLAAVRDDGDTREKRGGTLQTAFARAAARMCAHAPSILDQADVSARVDALIQAQARGMAPSSAWLAALIAARATRLLSPDVAHAAVALSMRGMLDALHRGNDHGVKDFIVSLLALLTSRACSAAAVRSMMQCTHFACSHALGCALKHEDTAPEALRTLQLLLSLLQLLVDTARVEDAGSIQTLCHSASHAEVCEFARSSGGELLPDLSLRYAHEARRHADEPTWPCLPQHVTEVHVHIPAVASERAFVAGAVDEISGGDLTLPSLRAQEQMMTSLAPGPRAQRMLTTQYGPVMPATEYPHHSAGRLSRSGLHLTSSLACTYALPDRIGGQCLTEVPPLHTLALAAIAAFPEEIDLRNRCLQLLTSLLQRTRSVPLAQAWMGAAVSHMCDDTRTRADYPQSREVATSLARECARAWERMRMYVQQDHDAPGAFSCEFPSVCALPPYLRNHVTAVVTKLAMDGHMPAISSTLLHPHTRACMPYAIHVSKACAWYMSSAVVSPGVRARHAADMQVCTPAVSLGQASVDAAQQAQRGSREHTLAVAAARASVRVCATAAYVHACGSEFLTTDDMEGMQQLLQHVRASSVDDMKLRCACTQLEVNLAAAREASRSVAPRNDVKFSDSILPLVVPVHPVTGSASTTVDSASDVDILLLHGLQGAALKTWRSPFMDPAVNPLPQEEGATFFAPNSVNAYIYKHGKRMAIWPAHLLPHDAAAAGARARVLALAFDAEILASAAIHPVVPLDRVARTLAEECVRAGVGANGRPVLILAHSMGGILFKLMMLDDSSASAQLRDAVQAVLFYATPHGGSRVAEVSVNYIHRWLGPLGTPHIIRLSEAQELLQLNGRFAELLVGRERGAAPIEVASFAEGRATCYEGAITGTRGSQSVASVVVVPEASANPGYGAFSVVQSADHVEVCKAETLDDVRYTRAQDALLHILDRARASQRE